MPRAARSIHAGVCYHVLNRGNNRGTVFRGAAEYRKFLQLVQDAQERQPLEIFGLCLMPNHFHLLARPAGPCDLGRWVHWLLTTHSHRHHLRRGTSGRVWQGRYKAFPVQQDRHFLVVLRYVERNAARAGLVTHSTDWPWGSAAWRSASHWSRLLAPPPVALPRSWSDWVDEPQTTQEQEAVRACIARPRPFGADEWIREAAECQPYRSSGRGPGRPRKPK